MRLKLITLLLIVTCAVTNGHSQYKQYRVKSKKTGGLADYLRPLNRSGWYIAPGVTMTPKLNFFKYDPILEIDGNNGTLSTIDLEQTSKLGLYLEGGRYKILRSRGLIHYIDYGLAYKQLKGEQSYGLSYDQISPDTTTVSFHEQSFSLHNATAHFNANHVIAKNRNFFIQNTLGVNIDYSFIRKTASDDPSIYATTYQNVPPRFGAQIHYKFGLGFKFSELVYLIPMIETPILNAWKFEGGRSTLGFFNSRYRPVIISLRIVWLTKPDCPRTEDGQGTKNDGGRPDVF